MKATHKILLGVTGGVAAYKAVELVRQLTQSGREVRVVMTEAAQHFVGTATFQAVSGHPVTIDAWDKTIPNGMPHIELARWADVILIAPASADFIAKLAHGFADDALSTLCLARDVPLLLAPAMNKQMWQQRPTQRNIATLRSDDAIIFGPASGAQACGETGDGRMLEASELVTALDGWAQPKVLTGLRAVITAGATQEAIDPVRVITNLSSGKMGFALAQACSEAGAEVILIAGVSALATPQGVKRIDVKSAAQMLAAVNAALDATKSDLFIAVAAVADYTPKQQSAQKMKKSDSALTIELIPTIDILASVAKRENPPFCVGFAAESENVITYAQAKRLRKGIPLIVANEAQSAFGAQSNLITLIDDTGVHPLPAAQKLTLARQIVAHIAAMRQR